MRLGSLLGLALYSTYVYGLTGHPLAWAMAQSGWGRPTQNPLTTLTTWFIEVGSRPVGALVDSPAEFLNGVAGIAALASHLSPSAGSTVAFGVFVVAGVLVPLTVGGMPALGRYTSVLFPIYLCMAAVLPARALPAVAIAGALGQAAIAAMFFTWRPVY